jgi:hypothetical protein
MSEETSDVGGLEVFSVQSSRTLKPLWQTYPVGLALPKWFHGSSANLPSPLIIEY